MTSHTYKDIVHAAALAVIMLAAMLMASCGWPPMPPEAWNEIAKRQTSFRAVGMLGVEPQTGTVFCIFCAVSYDRNVGQAPEPRP